LFFWSLPASSHRIHTCIWSLVPFVLFCLVLLFSFYLQSSVRVEKLEASGIIATSGNPVAEREMTITCHAPPGHYTILCATYQSGEEGPFRVTIHSNWPVGHSQLWPPEWKKEGLEGPKQTLKEKMVAGAKAKAEAAANAVKAQAAKARANAKAKVMQHTDWVDKDDENARVAKEQEKAKFEQSKKDNATDPNEDKLRKAKEMKAQWREKTGPDGTPYWYNKVTSVSTYDKPEGFMQKRDIKMLEIQVDQERTRKRVERMSRRGAAGGSNKAAGNESSDDDA
jgi:hypothetical protein